VTRVRNFRVERGAIPTVAIALSVDPDSPARGVVPALATLEPLLRHLGRLSDLRFEKAAPGAFQDVVAGLAVGMALPEGAAPEAGARVTKDLEATDDEILGLKAKLENAAYLAKAPPAVVEKTRQRLRELEQKRAALAVSGS
jgi:valyl-tRNA synthetase